MPMPADRHGLLNKRAVKQGRGGDPKIAAPRRHATLRRADEPSAQHDQHRFN